MARYLINRVRKYGFTLVELLIVVAIIGVLSTVGVPTFRRMVQRSKKSEAKVNLGGLYTAEQAFYAEYGSYGSLLLGIGYQVDGADLNYTIGFPAAANCTKGNMVAVPFAISPVGTAVNTSYAAYYANAGTITGRNNLMTSGCVQTPTGIAAYPAAFAANLGGYGNAEPFNVPGAVGVKGGVAATKAIDANVFVAEATGVIAPGVSRNAPANADLDFWVINHQRNIINLQDGTR